MTRRVFGIGETVLDIIFKGAQPIAARAGGSVLNALVSLARTGHEVHFVSEIGNDTVGDLVVDFWDSNRVGHSHVTRYPEGQTPLALAFLDNQNDATYEFYKPYPPQRTLNLPNDLTPNDVVLFGSFFAISPQVRPFVTSFVETAKKAGALIVYDPNFRASHKQDPRFIDIVKENMRYADIVRGSDEDFLNIFGTDQPQEIFEQISPLCNKLIVTANAKEIHIVTPLVNMHVPVDAIMPTSTIGAGDNFNAGLVKGIIDNGITLEKLQTLQADEWTKLVNCGKEFAKTVCQSIDNYVDDGFKTRLPLLLGQEPLSFNYEGIEMQVPKE